MSRIVIYNQQMLDVAIEDLKKSFEKNKRLNLFYEKASKERTLKQVGFTFAALINGITDYLQDCGFVLDNEDVRYALYDQVSQVVPEMIVDKQIFNGKPRIKHISEMDRELMSKFIDGIFNILDTNPLYAGIKLHPSIYYNYLWHLDPEEVKIAQKIELPEKCPEYLNYIRTLPCICCGIQHRSQAHHTKTGERIGMAIKTEDARAIPLCPNCHLSIAHGIGWKEAMKWLPYDFDTFTRLCYLRWKNKGGM